MQWMPNNQSYVSPLYIYVDFAASDVTCRRPCSSHWSLHSSSADWTTVTVYRLIYQPASSRSKCCSTAHLQIETLWAHRWYTDQPSLAARSRAYQLQSCRSDVPITARHSAALSAGVAMYLRRWYVDWKQTQISHDWSAHCAVLPSVNCCDGFFPIAGARTVYPQTSPLPRHWLFSNNVFRTFLFRRC